MFVLTISKKVKVKRQFFFQGSVIVLQKMASSGEVTVKLTNNHLENLRSAAKNKTGSTLMITKKNIQDEELPHELFLSTKQRTKIGNSFADNMSTDIKLSKAHLNKII